MKNMHIIIPAFVMAVCIITPLSLAYAKVFSRAAAQGFEFQDSIHTISLLETTASPLGMKALGGPEITIAHNTLVADIGSAGTMADLYDVPTGSTISVYVVRPGDTISTIATLFGVSGNTIRWANNLGPRDSIQIGQELLILPITGVRHTVQKGDTLATIASKYKGDKSEIARFNGLENDATLTPGEIVIVPQGEIVPVVNTTSSKKSTKNNSVRSSKIGTERCGISPSASACVPPTKTSLSGPSAGEGYFIRPVQGIVTQWFHGPYQAVDIGAPVGTPIVAAAGGRVITARSGWNGGYGTMVIIQHDNGSQSLYAHASKLHVSTGDTVQQGELIAEVGNTGRSTGPHLHLEFRGIKTPIIYQRPAR